ncbi:MAG: YtxH domain-containing protein [Gemmatimonadota bacterium]
MQIRRIQSGRDSASQVAGFVVGCLAGLAVGAAVGMLLAPHRGDITRRKLVRRAGQARDQVVDKVEDLMVHRREEADADADQEANS